MRELCSQIFFAFCKRHMLLKYKIFINVTLSSANEYSLFLHSLCGIIPGLSSIFLPRMNPFVLIDLAGAFALCITYMLIEMNNYFAVDTASVKAIALMTFGTLYPVSAPSDQVSHQIPLHVIGQLDKLIIEGSTLDGVLEV